MPIDRKTISRFIQELYLYPNGSKEENTIHGGVWIVSWLVGIAGQQQGNQQALAGTYFVFALSLLLELVPARKTMLLTKIIHGLFLGLLLVMFSGAILLCFQPASTATAERDFVSSILIQSPPYVGWIVFFLVLLDLILGFIELHKLVYDEEAAQNAAVKEKREEQTQRFTESLNGPNEGGKAQCVQ